MKIAREGAPIVAAAAAVAAIAGLAVHYLVAVALAPAVFFAYWFFRDPERRPPDDPDALVSPADGRIIEAGPERISIFMNVFDVHVCRAPTAGRVDEVRHRPGRFLAAFRSEAPEQNESVSLVLARGPRRIRFDLVAGLVARRIVCRVAAGQHVAAGERIGIIRFGSRVDVAVPPGAEVAVRRGQRVVAGETVIGRLPVGEAGT